MKNAFLAIILIAPLFGLVGTMIVNNKMSFFSDAMGHCALTGIALGIMLGIDNYIVSMLVFALIFALWAIREVCGAIFALFFAFDTVFSLQKQFLPCFLHAGLFFCPKSNFCLVFCT